MIGIEDDADTPPAGQTIETSLPETILRKVGERTVNVTVVPKIVQADNGAEYLEVTILRSTGVASTTDGRYFLRVADDRLEVVNPGPFPLGVTPRNILHQSVRRNDHLARLFHDLKLMEREGSGIDKVYEVLLSQGRPAPELEEGPDHVKITVRRRILKPRVVDFLDKADQTYQLHQRERITLGLLAQHDSLTARELAAALALSSTDLISSWLGRLPELGLVRTSGRTRATRYFVDHELLRSLNFHAPTRLGRIEPHRLEALILEDVRRYPGSRIGEIRQRVGEEIPRSRIKQTLSALVRAGRLKMGGRRAGARYHLPE